jgi:hypothetical protein
MSVPGILERLPRWFAEQAQVIEHRARQQRESAARRQEMEFICAVEVKDSGWDEWEDTVAAFNAR